MIVLSPPWCASQGRGAANDTGPAVTSVAIAVGRLVSIALAGDFGEKTATAPSPARHGGCKKTATAAPLALSRN